MTTTRASKSILLSLISLGGLAVVPPTTHAEIFSSFQGVTPGAPDNPIPRSALSVWETTVVEYRPAPGVGAAFTSPTTGFGSLGDLYSPVTRPDGPNIPFDRRFHPEPGTSPPFHPGGPFNGNIFDLTDNYGFIGIDQPGSITLGFGVAIINGPGHDFAVFENGFQFGGPHSLFAELAYVEVSTDGLNFARFASISLNTAPTATAGTFQGYDVRNIYNLAGKHATNWGTPFDLEELTSHPLTQAGLLDLMNVRFVRLVDVVGSGELLDNSGNPVPGIARDSEGRPILDNWVTFNSGGFDYLGLPTGAVGVVHFRPLDDAIPEPSGLFLAAIAVAAMARRIVQRRHRG